MVFYSESTLLKNSVPQNMKVLLLYELEKLKLASSYNQLKILYSTKTKKIAETVFQDSKYKDCLIHYEDFIGCECPIVVLFFQKTENHWQLLEMASRAQFKVRQRIKVLLKLISMLPQWQI